MSDFGGVDLDLSTWLCRCSVAPCCEASTERRPGGRAGFAPLTQPSGAPAAGRTDKKFVSVGKDVSTCSKFPLQEEPSPT